MEMLRVTAEFAGRNWSAYSPNLPGVIAAANTFQELLPLFVDAARDHIDLLHEEGDRVPPIDFSRVLVHTVVYLTSLGEFRKYAGLRQKDVASSLGLSQPRVAEIEKQPSSVSYENLMQYLEIVSAKAGLDVPPVLVSSA